MFKGRSGTIILGILIILVLLAIVYVSRGQLGLFSKPDMTLPVDLAKVIPTGWDVFEKQTRLCDYDSDGEDEWLILYRYDQTQVSQPQQPAGTMVDRSPIGGVIYDAQVNRVPQEPGNQSPYRPAFLIPYKLLPDFYTGKGQGYLGESSVTPILHKPDPKAAACKTDEIAFLGYSEGPLPTRLSIFRWTNKSIGYRGVHFVGNARIEATPDPSATDLVTRVRTYDRLQNHRSILCESREFTRAEPLTSLTFPENPNSYTIDFCFGAPKDPPYPEGVVMAMLRGSKAENTSGNTSPTGESFFTANADLPADLRNLQVTRVLAISNQGTVAPHPDNGRQCSPAELKLPADDRNTWWCGREEAEVITEIVIDRQPDQQTYQVVWHLISIANDKTSADVHWRIDQATFR